MCSVSLEPQINVCFLEMRTKFDHGEDPMDPESQQGHHHPFHGGFHGFQGFNPFGSGPFNFKFSYNWEVLVWSRTGADFPFLPIWKGARWHKKNMSVPKCQRNMERMVTLIKNSSLLLNNATSSVARGLGRVYLYLPRVQQLICQHEVHSDIRMVSMCYALCSSHPLTWLNLFINTIFYMNGFLLNCK